VLLHLRREEMRGRGLAALALAAAIAGCSSPAPAPPAAQAKPAAASATPAVQPAPASPGEEAIPPPAYESALPEEMRSKVDTPFTGDFDAMVGRRMIRAGVPFNRSFYFVDKGLQRGLSYEYLMQFEEALNKKLKTGTLKVHVVLLPAPRDALIPLLRAGKIDLIVAQVTVTPAREALVDFTRPTRDNVNEIVVTGPGAAPLSSVRGLSGREVFVRKTSSYYDSLIALNRTLEADGKPPVDIHLAPESLEDDDLLEMVNAGLIPAIVVDGYLAEYWKQVWPTLNLHPDVTLRTGGHLAVAIRKGNPKLAEELNAFIADNGLNSVMGRVLGKRYLQSTTYVKNATAGKEREKFLALVAMFRTYGERYKFDYLMMAAQGYQKSRLDQNAKSSVGAIGVMQLMPATGKEQAVGDITKIEQNVHAGVKYMRFIRNSFFEDQPMDDLNKALFTFAAYNAGPGRIRQLRREAGERGLDPNLWFGNVERIASERIGRETVTYVSNIYKYYVAYRLITEEVRRRAAAKSTFSRPGRGGTVR
jgi:membrane-bound lytic murein transglycosylase MltF